MFENILLCLNCQASGQGSINRGYRKSQPQGTQVLSGCCDLLGPNKVLPWVQWLIWYAICYLEAPLSDVERSCLESCQLHTYFPYSVWGTIPWLPTLWVLSAMQQDKKRHVKAWISTVWNEVSKRVQGVRRWENIFLGERGFGMLRDKCWTNWNSSLLKQPPPLFSLHSALYRIPQAFFISLWQSSSKMKWPCSS